MSEEAPPRKSKSGWQPGVDRRPQPDAGEPGGAPRSRRRWLAFLAALAVPLLLAMWLYHRHEQRDTWAGRTASEWSVKLVMGNGEERKQAEIALRALGSNAVPSLCRAMFKSDSRARALLLRLARRAPLTLREWVYRNFLGTDPGTVRLAAAQALAFLGPEAESAIPDLVACLSSSDSSVAWQASQTLGRIGPAAVPVLVPLLEQTDDKVRLQATYAIAQIGRGANAATSALVNSLGSTNQALCQASLQALGRIWTNPVLQYSNLIATQRGSAREVTARAVRQFNLPSRRIQPVLVEMLRDDSPTARLAAVQGLGQLQGWTPATFASLCRAGQDADPLVRSNALQVLAEPNLRARVLPDSLLEILADRDASFRPEAARALGALGTNAISAVPQLEALVGGVNGDLRQAALEALKRITNRPAN